MSFYRTRLSLLVTLSLCTFCLLLAAFSRAAFASSNVSDPITITTQTYSIHFPSSIDFYISVNDANSTISKASFFIEFDPGNNRETHNLAISRPLGIITLHWHENTSGRNFYPAGTHVNYSWQIQDSAGYSYTGTSQQFSTIDTRFAWQHLSAGLLQVNWYNRSQDFGQAMLDKADASISRISAVLGGGLIHPINLWIYETNDDFHGSLAPNSYEWVGGEALPSLDEASITVLSTSDETLVRDMPHELTHLIFHQLTEKGPLASTWFDEGLAVYNQLYHEPEMIQRFKKALATHSLLRLDMISSNFPVDADQAYLAYAQSWQLVDYMYSTFGQPKMAQLIQQINSSTDFGQDLQKALGEDQPHLENSWHLSLHQPPVLSADMLTPTPQAIPTLKPINQSNDGSIWLLTSLGVVLILGALIGLLLIVINLRSSRENPLAAQTAVKPPVEQGVPPQWQQNNRNAPQVDLMGTSQYAPPFVQHQEYLSQKPRKRAPQE